MGLIVISIVMGALGLLLGLAGAALGAWALIQVEAMKRSTHSIEYVAPEALMQNASARPTPADDDVALEKAAKREGFVPTDDDDFEDT